MLKTAAFPWELGTKNSSIKNNYTLDFLQTSGFNISLHDIPKDVYLTLDSVFSLSAFCRKGQDFKTCRIAILLIRNCLFLGERVTAIQRVPKTQYNLISVKLRMVMIFTSVVLTKVVALDLGTLFDIEPTLKMILDLYTYI